MQRTGSEWIFRLLQEPRRLFNRYLVDLIFFVRALRRERRVLRARRTSSPAALHPARAPSGSVTVHRWSGDVDAAAIHGGRLAPVPPTQK